MKARMRASCFDITVGLRSLTCPSSFQIARVKSQKGTGSSLVMKKTSPATPSGSEENSLSAARRCASATLPT